MQALCEREPWRPRSTTWQCKPRTSFRRRSIAPTTNRITTRAIKCCWAWLRGTSSCSAPRRLITSGVTRHETRNGIQWPGSRGCTTSIQQRTRVTRGLIFGLLPDLLSLAQGLWNLNPALAGSSLLQRLLQERSDMRKDLEESSALVSCLHRQTPFVRFWFVSVAITYWLSHHIGLYSS